MTGNLVLDLAISLAGIAFLVAVSYALGAFQTAVVTEASAIERAFADEPDFVPSRWLVDANGKSAIAASEAGEIILVFSHGDRLATRRFASGSRPARHEGPVVRLELGELGLSAVQCTAGDAETAAEWVGVLNAPGVKSRDGVS